MTNLNLNFTLTNEDKMLYNYSKKQLINMIKERLNMINILAKQSYSLELDSNDKAKLIRTYIVLDDLALEAAKM